jgi:hypothetical protein
VEVEGALPGATIEIYEAGTSNLLGSATAASAEPQWVGSLNLGSVGRIEAKVSLASGAHAVSTAVDVIAAPATPSQPLISRPTRACATHVGVHTVPGATVEVTFKNQVLPVVIANRRAIIVPLPNAAATNDPIQARQRICSSAFGPMDMLNVEAAPNPLPAPIFPPQREGESSLRVHNLTGGATMELFEFGGSTPLWSHPSWPFDNITFARQLMAGERFTMTQTLCGQPVTTVHSDFDGVGPCPNGVEPPVVVPPAAGDEILVLGQAVPGAIVHVWRNGSYLVSGTGTIIRLGVTLVAGDLVTVSLNLGACAGDVGTTWTVQP